MASQTAVKEKKARAVKSTKTQTKSRAKKKTKQKKNLVIVESPSKAKTIEKYLGRNYKVVASIGHIRDLPKSTMGVDIENDYQPKYINIRGKGDIIKSLKKDAKAAKHVYLASDPDREGEAIAWHLSHILDLDLDSSDNRVVFNEITKDAVKDAFNIKKIDMDLVDAKQAAASWIASWLFAITILCIKQWWIVIGRAINWFGTCYQRARNASFEPDEYWSLTQCLKRAGRNLKPFYGWGKDVLADNDAVQEVLKRWIATPFNDYVVTKDQA